MLSLMQQVIKQVSATAVFLLWQIIPAGSISAQPHTRLTAGTAQSQPYSGEEQREIKALSAEMIEGYRKGRGMGFAKAAELNHYPGPMHVLELKQILGLTPEQERTMNDAYNQMHDETVRLGKALVEEEKALDSLFTHGKADSASVRRITTTIGGLQAAIRFAHLNAHIIAQAVLTKEQILQYDQERGYISLSKDKRSARELRRSPKKLRQE
ncbi:MAG: Spy/CpxP family protein refolding chaperone [Candidatus Kapabacteria bacterium]|jgi:Spy/CpxP family protein refolding chaperone|nr:Spy/CpxP family protein refolding chaperone [Candidatus Kapabacteria bacterium]